MPSAADITDERPTEITLPEIVLGPIRYPIGEAYQLLRSSCKKEVLNIQDIRVSPKVSEKCYTLDGNEKIIVTCRRKLNRPEGVNGVLRCKDNDSYEWISHEILDVALEKVRADGLGKLSKEAVKSWEGSFTFRAEKLDANGLSIDGGEGLRPPQLGALFAIGAHWSLYKNPATVVMPTGTGKTETMLATLAAYQCSPILVATPSKALRDQTARKFKNFGLLRKLKVLNIEVDNPVVGIVKRRPKSTDDLKIFEDCNAIVGVMPSLSGGTAAQLG